MANDFAFKVQRHLERLQHCSFRDIEAEVAQKRRAWFQNNLIAARLDRPTPRQAFDLLFFDYMGLSPADLPIVSESETEIVWQSANPCPTLEAVKALGLDTRVVCRATTEKSTQAFVSQIDPQLRFLRSYEEIRPYANHCRELIVRVDFEAMMCLALEEAELSRQEGNKGYGAVVVLGQRILSRAHDTAVTQCNPGPNKSDSVLAADENPPFLPLDCHARRAGANTVQQGLHAEVNAIRHAVHVLGDTNLSGAILFSTREPCPRCSSLAVWANLTTIVYGASIEETAQPGEARLHVSAQEIVEASPATIEVIGGVLRTACLALYR
jgi:tRNA(Arg) A34 adenosine deaminase TadA